MNIRKEVADAEMFVTQFAAGGGKCSTPHIYISGLSLCPRSSSVYKNYWRQSHGLIDVKGTAMAQWETAAIGRWMTDSPIDSIAFSPNGSCIISSSDDHTI